MTTATISKSALNSEGSKLLDFIITKTDGELHQLLPSLPLDVKNGHNKLYMLMFTQQNVPVAYRFLDKFIDDLSKTSFRYVGTGSLNLRITILEVTSKRQLKLEKIRLQAGQHRILKQYVLKSEFLNEDYLKAKFEANKGYRVEEVKLRNQQTPLTVLDPTADTSYNNSESQAKTTEPINKQEPEGIKESVESKEQVEMEEQSRGGQTKESTNSFNCIRPYSRY